MPFHFGIAELATTSHGQEVLDAGLRRRPQDLTVEVKMSLVPLCPNRDSQGIGNGGERRQCDRSEPSPRLRLNADTVCAFIVLTLREMAAYGLMRSDRAGPFPTSHLALKTPLSCIALRS